MSDAAALVPAARGTDFAAALAAPPLANLRRIGGEMFAWTDRDPRRGPALPRGAVLRHLLLGLVAPGHTVLVAGPHTDDTVAALAGTGAAVTWLLRSLSDAEAAARLHTSVTVLAGAAGKLDPADRFDLVVAVDGVERLNSVEGEQLTAAELLDRLAEAVRPDGALVLVHDNHFGLQHTVRLEPGARESEDAAWYPADEYDPHRPASRDQLTRRLTGAGLAVDATYAAFPEPSAPTVLVGGGLLGDVTSPLRPRLGTALSQAFAAAYRDRPVLSDPRRLAGRALRAGAEDAVAPAWLVIARGPERARTTGHDLLIGDVTGTFTYEVDASGRTTVLCPLEGPVERGGLRRIGQPVAPGADAGYILEERLLHLCARADVRGLRAELTQFDAWLGGRATGDRLAGPAALAGFADVLITGDGPALLPTRWEPVDPVPLATARVRTFWEFAVHLLTSGRSHPWPVTSSAVDLTATLLGMVGRDAAPEDIRAAVELHVRLEAADHDLTLDQRQERERMLLAVTAGTASVDVEGYRELAEALWRQRYEASHLLAMMEWTEQIIQSRDNQLSRMDQQIQFYKSGLVGKMLLGAREAYRVVSRDGRKYLRGRKA